MIEIQIKTEDCFLEAKGHAGCGESGKDIVCAAVSVLVSTLASCVRTAYDNGLLKRKPNIELGEDGSGYALISCQPKKKYHSLMVHDFSVIVSGIVMLSEQYPKAVKLRYID